MEIIQRAGAPINGVSQASPLLRDPTQAQESINWLPSVVDGLRVRPPTEHIARIDRETYGATYQHAFYYQGARYTLTVREGVPRIFRADGSEVGVKLADGVSSYLEDGDYVATSYGDQLILANRRVQVGTLKNKRIAGGARAVVTVRSGFPETNYGLVVNGVQVNYTTPNDSNLANRQKGRPDGIAVGLHDLIRAHPKLSGEVDVEVRSNVLVIYALNGKPLSVEPLTAETRQVRFPVFDKPITIEAPRIPGSLEVIVNRVTSYAELPEVASGLHQVEVQGSPESDRDNYWVEFEAFPGSGSAFAPGRWKEIAKPGTEYLLDPSTLPVVLKPYDRRLPDAGDLATPSIGATKSFTTYRSGLAEPYMTETVVTWDLGAIYPADTTATLVTGGMTVTIPPVNFNRFGFDMAALFENAINGNPSATVQARVERDVLYLSTKGSVPGPFGPEPLAAPETTWSVTIPRNTNYIRRDAKFTPGSLAGSTLRNATDGSTCTVVSNTDQSIVTTPLTGGTDNTFTPGDDIEIISGDRFWVCERPEWAPREAGDLQSVPWPSFVGNTINDVFTYQGRLGFLSGSAVILSATREPYRFFRRSAAQLLDSDPIDVRSLSSAQAVFRFAVDWNGRLIVATDRGPYAVTSGEAITPTSVRFDLLVTLEDAGACRPVVSGSRLLFARSIGGATRITEVSYPAEGGTTPQVTDLTALVPTYLDGAPIAMEVDETLGMLFVHTTRGFYLYRSTAVNGQTLQSAWQRWDFPLGKVIDMEFEQGILTLIMERPDGLFLERIQLGSRMPTALVDRLGWSNPVAYRSTLELSPIYFRGRDGQNDPHGRYVLRTLTVDYTETEQLEVSFTSPGRAIKGVPFSSTTPQTGRHRVSILAVAKDTRITITASAPACITGLDAEASYTPRRQRV